MPLTKLGWPGPAGNGMCSSKYNIPVIYLQYMAMDQYLLIPFLGEWTSIYQLFWCSPGVQGFDTLPYEYGQILTIQKNHWPLGHFCEPWNFATEHVPHHIHMISPIFPRRRVQSAWRAFKAQSPQWGEPLVAQNSALKKIFFIGIMWGKSRPW
jgi:hypothetical protein